MCMKLYFCFPLFILGTIWTDFSPQIIGFDLNKFSIIVWDPPGYGKSIPPKRDFCIDYLERDADLAAQLLQVCHFLFFKNLVIFSIGILKIVENRYISIFKIE